MSTLPIVFQKYFSEGSTSASVTLTYWFEPQDKTELKEKGRVGMLVSLLGPDDFNGETAAKFMWDSFRESYFDSDGQTADNPNSVCLKTAVKAAQKCLMNLIRNDESVSEQGVDLHLCAISVCKDKVNFSLVGNPGLVLARDSKIIDLAEMMPSYNGIGYKGEVSVGSFEVKKLDIILVATPELIDSFLGVFGSEKSGDQTQGDTQSETCGDILSDWQLATKELSLFSDNMVGSQYFWLLGCGVKVQSDKDESNKSDSSETRVDLISAESVDVDTKKPFPEILKTALATAKQKISDKLKRSKTSTTKDTKDTKKEQDTQGIHASPKGTPKSRKNTPKSIKEKLTKWYSEHVDMDVIKRNIRAKISSFKVGDIKGRLFVNAKGNRFYSGRNPKKYAVIAGIIMLIVATVLIIMSQRNKAIQAQIDSEITILQETVIEAEEIWTSDKLKAAELIQSAFSRADDIDNYGLSEGQQNQVADLKNQAQEISDSINRIIPLSEARDNIEILLDTYLKIGESSDIQDFAIRGGTLYLVDKASHTLYKYELGGSAVEKVANSSDILKEPVRLSFGEKFLFIYDTAVGVVSLDVEQDPAEWSLRVMPELSARTIGNVEELGGFADNIYILKKDEARVLKSYPAGVGYSYPEEYFRHGAFDKACDLLIDGNIYVLSNASEKIYKFYGGQQDTFQLSEFDVPLGKVSCGFTNLSDSNPLYVYDDDNDRVVVVEKGTAERHPGVGVMLKQYVYRGERDDIFQNVKELVVDAEEKNLYVLDGTMVLKVSLEGG
ncbi:MAG: hypothetical protein U9Q67_00655 [Patescibacteria group bacterium]|nr:hypothetical protein [Patescibacteria group bacterium]